MVINYQGSLNAAEFSRIEETSLLVIGKRRYNGDQGFSQGFLHELGHSLGLRDESPRGARQQCLPGPPNCASYREEAEHWWGELAAKNAEVDYFSGCCGRTQYIRPTATSLMNDPEDAEGYGPVNEQFLRNCLKIIRESDRQM